MSGGEPTIHPDIVRLLAHAKALGLSVVMSTHGRVRQRVIDCAQFTDWIAIPVDGISNSMLAQMRGRPWGLAEADSLVKDLRRTNPGIRIKLGTVATAVNHYEIPALASALVESGIMIDTWKIYQYTARRQFKHRASEFQMPDAAFRGLQDSVHRAIPTSTFQVVFSSNASRRGAYLFIYPDGTVAVPNVGEGMDDFVVGNLNAEGPEVLERAKALDWDNHLRNYHGTYVGNVACLQ